MEALHERRVRIKMRKRGEESKEDLQVLTQEEAFLRGQELQNDATPWTAVSGS